jgi:hypothetical protein
MCKGAAMIAPNMGTMLGVLLTDAALTPTAAQQSLSQAVDETFNCISVDGHMSTNDTVLLLANGAAGGREGTGNHAGDFGYDNYVKTLELYEANGMGYYAGGRAPCLVCSNPLSGSGSWDREIRDSPIDHPASLQSDG